MSSRPKEHTPRPLVLLDVDGVINDAEMLVAIRLADDSEAAAEQLEIDVIESHGHHVAVPRYMPGLIQALVAECEVLWCSTWRSFANDEIAAHLGIGPLLVVDDGTLSAGTAWKAGAARPAINDALAAGRPVIWIEDFGGTFPDIDGVTFIDTAEWGVLRPIDLDVEALVGR
jgi:hypothetical protein